MLIAVVLLVGLTAIVPGLLWIVSAKTGKLSTDRRQRVFGGVLGILYGVIVIVYIWYNSLDSFPAPSGLFEPQSRLLASLVYLVLLFIVSYVNHGPLFPDHSALRRSNTDPDTILKAYVRSRWRRVQLSTTLGVGISIGAALTFAATVTSRPLPVLFFVGVFFFPAMGIATHQYRAMRTAERYLLLEEPYSQKLFDHW